MNAGMRGWPSRPRLVSLALGASIAAIAVGTATSAAAQCSPDPTVANGTTTCTGVDPDGLRVTTAGTTVQVEADAFVTAAAAPAIMIEGPSDAFSAAPVKLTVDGSVDGIGQAGIAILSGPSFTFEDRATIVIGSSGSVSGASGITVGQSPSAGFTSSVAALDNAGAIRGADGVALRSTAPDRAGFRSIINRATGTIGAISSPIGSFDNAGLIDGRSLSAIDVGTRFNGAVRGGVFTNSGRITNNGAVATIANLGSGNPIMNSGSINNAGTGAAIDIAALSAEITNAVGGLIATSGTTAISAPTTLRLVNEGGIVGDVAIGSESVFFGGSRIDSSKGSITGNVVFGATDDTLVTRYTGTATLTTGITGMIDAGAGVNRIEIAFDADTTLATPIDFLPGFQQLSLAAAAGVTATIVDGFVAPGAVELAGEGSYVNEASLVAAGPLFTTRFFDGPLAFTNQGSIRTTSGSPDQFALRLDSIGIFTNSGVVEAAGAGVSVSGDRFVNDGVITATGTAALAAGSLLTNTGVIRSTAGTAAGITLSGGQIRTKISTNSGTIEGFTAGVAADAITLVNTGTIEATAGIGVDPGAYSTIDNRAGGVIRGMEAAIGYGDRFGFRAIIINAGAIDGTVDLANRSVVDDTSEDTYADAGGTVRGDVLLGGGNDLFLTDIDRVSDGRIVGVTGVVDGGAGVDSLRLRVATDRTAAITPIAGFEAIGYELANDAALTLTAAASLSATLGLAGRGSVDLTADITITDDRAIDLTVPTLDQLLATTFPGGEAPALAVVSRGTVSYTRVSPSSFYAGVLVSGGSSFENAGTLNVTTGLPSDGLVVGILGSTFPYGGVPTIINSGTISLDGATGISGDYAAIMNSGRIVQATGTTAAARGVTGSFDLRNSGTIETAGVAVTADGSSTIANSGRIASSGAEGVRATASNTVVNNLAGGVITGSDAAIRTFGGATVTNAGIISGDVLFNVDSFFGGSSVYIADGGRIEGNLLFGSGDDALLVRNGEVGVSDAIDGGGGFDLFGASFTDSGTVTLGGALPTSFEGETVEALGQDTTVVLDGPAGGIDRGLRLYGDGTFVNRTDILGTVDGLPYGVSFGNDVAGAFNPSLPGSFANEATILNGVFGSARLFNNSGTIGTTAIANSVYLTADGDAPFTFGNSGTIIGSGQDPLFDTNAAQIFQRAGLDGDAPAAFINNQGRISGGLLAGMQATTLSFVNEGAITRASIFDAAVLLANSTDAAQTVTAVNSGSILSDSAAGSGLLVYANSLNGPAPSVAVTNSGTIAVRGNGLVPTGGMTRSSLSTALLIAADAAGDVSVINKPGGNIAASVPGAIALAVPSGSLQLVNEGAITGGGGTTLAVGELARIGAALIEASNGFLAGAIQTAGGNDIVRNAGTITGSIDLGAGADLVENRGLLDGDVFLRAGDDVVVQSTGATIIGTVDAGEGQDLLRIDAAGDGAISAVPFIGFERLIQSGAGNVVYSGGFQVGTIELAGGVISVASATTLATVGPVTITGGAIIETVNNAGTIAGALDLGDGDDLVVNTGLVGGPVALGGGADRYVEGAGASAAAGVDGGEGQDLYRVLLAGDRSGLGARTGFEALSVEGAGTLSLTLDQDFQSVTLAGTGLDLRLAGFEVDRIDGGAGADRAIVDGDVATVALDAGDDLLSLGATRAAGAYNGGAGADTLRLVASGPNVLAGTATGFELLSIAGAGGLTIASGAFRFDRVDAAGDVRIASDAALATTRLGFGDGADRLVIAGGFSGSVAGGAGADTIEVSGGSAAAPVAFGSLLDVEAFRMAGGLATVGGTAALGSIDLSGGRLIGSAGSTISAATILVRQGATFGSAGTVSGTLSVAGTLSPGASPGVMTVNGSVALAGTSTTLFEITPTVSDKLVVNGTVSIAPGATLRLEPMGPLAPGTSLDLITATGGITGGFTSLDKPASLFGFLTQDANRIRLLGQFRVDAGFGPQVGRTIDYVNALLGGGRASTGLLAAAPGLVDANGASNAGAFALIAPETYASAGQAAVENGLTIAEVGRGSGFASRRTEPGLFTFGQVAADQRTLRADVDRGTARAKFGGYGLFGGLGYAGEDWSLGGFVGYLDGKQRLDARGSATELEGAVFGVHGRVVKGPLGLTATAAYAATEAGTRRSLPGGSARATYDLTGLTLDVAATYEIAISDDWALRPRVGGTVVRVKRDAVSESGTSAFAAQVARDRDTAAFTDGTLTIAGGAAPGARVRPYATIGLRYQVKGRDSLALAGFGGGDLGLIVEGVERARMLGTAALGAEADVSAGVTLFAAIAAERGNDDRRESARVGMRVRF